MSKARWYKAVGGDGLEIQREGDAQWSLYGTVQKNRSYYDAMLNRNEESFSLGLFSTRAKAMEYLLNRSGARLDSHYTESKP